MRTPHLFLAALGLIAAAGPLAQEDTPDFLKAIDGLIADHNYHAVSDDHFVVKTDDPRLDIDAVASLLDSFHAFFEGFWSDRLKLKEAPDRSRIYLFYSRFKYKQLLEDLPPDLVDFVGHYTADQDVVALHTDSVGLANLADLLVHEAAHRLVQVRIYGDDYVPSPWVGEGLASYFGNTLRDRSGEFLPGRIGGKSASFFDGVSATQHSGMRRAFDEYRRAVKKGESIPVQEIVETEGDAFYSEDGADERYTASWLLIHFLLHAEEGAHAASLARYLQDEAQGRRGPEIFYEDIGMTPEALQTSFTDYVSSLKAR